MENLCPSTGCEGIDDCVQQFKGCLESLIGIIVKTEEVVKYNYDTLINDHHSINVAFKELEAITNV